MIAIFSLIRFGLRLLKHSNSPVRAAGFLIDIGRAEMGRDVVLAVRYLFVPAECIFGTQLIFREETEPDIGEIPFISRGFLLSLQESAVCGFSDFGFAILLSHFTKLNPLGAGELLRGEKFRLGRDSAFCFPARRLCA